MSNAGAEGEDHPSGNGEISVLLVDDDETWVRSISRLLARQHEGLTVTTATDVAGAAATFRETDPDCVVSDYYLGEETGLDLLETVRERAPDRPFILITGQGDESIASDAIRREVSDYLPKRSIGNDGELARRIDSTVATHRRKQALDRERRSKEAMLEILRTTDSREGIARRFCDHLVDSGYACSWIAVSRPDGVVPLAVAGADGYVDAVVEPGTTPGESSEPALTALDSRERRTWTAPREGAVTDHWEMVAAEYGFRSAAAVPIEHGDALLGVLAVYRTDRSMPAERGALIETYGETIGYALRTSDWKESLLSSTPVAVEMEFTAGSIPLLAAVDALPRDAHADVRSTVPREETLLYIVECSDISAGTLRERVDSVDAVESVSITRDASPLRCELAVPRPTPETVIADSGGHIADVGVGRESLVITSVGPDDGAVQELVDAVQSRYPGSEVRSFRSDAVPLSRQDDVLEPLTDKQRRALEVAYYNGYFERPREHDTTEVASKLGVTRQTLSQHLRSGQGKVFSQLFDARQE